MRLLIYGMQSSGATAFSLFLAQRPACLGLVDILNNYAAPRLETELDVVAKVVVTTAYPLEVHQERFRPDRTILFLRDPRDNFESLRRKNYCNHSGLMDEKFALLDRIFEERGRFDAVIEYEDFVGRAPHVLEEITGLGWPVNESHYNFRRTHAELAEALWNAVPGLFQRFEFSYGNVQSIEVSDRFRDKAHEEGLEKYLETLCPLLLDHYRRRGARRNVTAPEGNVAGDASVIERPSRPLQKRP